MPDAAVFTFPIAKENLHDLSKVLLPKQSMKNQSMRAAYTDEPDLKRPNYLETITLLMPYLVDGDLNTQVPWKEKWVFAISLK